MLKQYGYGDCRFQISYSDLSGNNLTEFIRLKVDHSVFPEENEVANSYINIYGNPKKHILGLVRKFNIRVTDYDSTSNVNTVANLLSKIKLMRFDWFYFWLHYPWDESYYCPLTTLLRYKVGYNNPRLGNLVSNYGLSAHTLDLELTSQLIKTTDDKYIYTVYRDTVTGDWNTFPAYPGLTAVIINSGSYPLGMV
jgi:hypothetical protein